MFYFCILVAQTGLVCYIAKDDLEPLILLYKLVFLKPKSCCIVFRQEAPTHTDT